MKANLSIAIADYLWCFGNVFIPGLGVFKIEQNVESVKLGDRSIFPNTEKISFYEDVQIEGSLDEYISNRLAISIKKSKKKINKYSQKIINALLNYDKADIPGIGSLEKISNQDNIVFKQTLQNFDIENYYLPELALEPIDYTQGNQENVILAPVEEVNHEEVEELIEHKIVDNTGSDEVLKEKIISPILEEDNRNKTIEETDKKKESQKNVKTSKSSEFTKSREEEKIPNDYYIENKPFKGCLSALLGGVLLFLLLWLLVDKCSNAIVPNHEGNTSESEVQVDSTAIDTETSSLRNTLKNINNHPNFEEYKEFLTEDIIANQCIIIVGSFMQPANADKLKDRLIRDGYQPYTEVYNEFVRIGVIFDCQEFDLIDYLNNIRKDFNEKAWYLSPDMEVPYY